MPANTNHIHLVRSQGFIVCCPWGGEKKNARPTRSLWNHFVVVRNGFRAWENVLQWRGRSKASRRLARLFKSAHLLERRECLKHGLHCSASWECWRYSRVQHVYFRTAPPLWHHQKGRRLYVTSPPQTPAEFIPRASFQTAQALNN